MNMKHKYRYAIETVLEFTCLICAGLALLFITLGIIKMFEYFGVDHFIAYNIGGMSLLLLSVGVHCLLKDR